MWNPARVLIRPKYCRRAARRFSCRWPVQYRFRRTLPACAGAGTYRKSFEILRSRFPGRYPSPRTSIFSRHSGGGNMHSRDSGVLVLDGIADEFWNNWMSCILSAMTAGSGSCVTTRAAVFDGAAQIEERLLEGILRWKYLRSLPFGPDARKRQQILDQSLHAAGAVHRESDKLIGVGVQLSFVASGLEAGCSWPPSAAAPANRGRQCRQIGPIPHWSGLIPPPFGEDAFGCFPRGDVADRRGHQDSFGAFQRAQHHLDRKLAAILSPPGELNPRADLLRQRVFRGSQCRPRSAAPRSLPE